MPLYDIKWAMLRAIALQKICTVDSFWKISTDCDLSGCFCNRLAYNHIKCLLWYHVTLVTLTEYFRNRCLRSILQKYMVAKVSQFPCKFHWYSQWLHLNNLFYKTSMLTPFVKPCQVLSYLDVAIAKNSRNSHKIACKFRNFLSVKLAKIGRENIWSV